MDEPIVEINGINNQESVRKAIGEYNGEQGQNKKDKGRKPKDPNKVANHTAIPNWSGYIYQGLCAAYVAYQRSICLTLSKKNNEELKKLDDLLDKCKKYDGHLLAIKNKVTKQRGDYLTKVISDIQSLFYIYSGRIMQDSYYGRGIYLKRVVSTSGKSRIIFVSGDYNNDLDVLYNMSSGQLISVAIAFLLALNKLYDNIGFLAIDDPVQTIDDINLWGLIETIRHEFANKDILLSTHEDDNAALIRYKLSMMGLKASALDMSTIHKNRKDDNNEN